jgi:bifunctional UDP-N-acetylglucosamine pyrophosphorylase/glucosamine-1-phosphate N-acetyltransferase
MANPLPTIGETSAASRTLAVILAAGQGTRMRSALPKVLHKVAGLSMIGHVLTVVSQSVASAATVVVGPDREDVADEARRVYPDSCIAVQTDRLGTAHAVLQARESIGTGYDVVIVLYADTPLVRAETIARLRDAVSNGAAVAALGFEARDPTGYGRFIMAGDELLAIREHKDASDTERRITLCNAGLMALDGRRALELLRQIGNANAQNEFYLTDAVEVARRSGLKTVAVAADEDEVMGIDDRVKLAAAERIMQDRLREKAMRNGATLIDPASTYFNHDTRISSDVMVEPNVFFGPDVVIEADAVIHAYSHIEGSIIGKGVHVGPFARLRPGAVLDEGARVGNFCEVKNATIGAGAKVNHLSYIGDADVGAKANIGAGTITCNYDGVLKHRTTIGAGAFIGSNSSLVAPVTVGAGAYVGSGSVVTRDVSPEALAIARGQQVEKPGWARLFREKQSAKKRQK